MKRLIFQKKTLVFIALLLEVGCISQALQNIKIKEPKQDKDYKLLDKSKIYYSASGENIIEALFWPKFKISLSRVKHSSSWRESYYQYHLATGRYQRVLEYNSFTHFIDEKPIVNAVEKIIYDPDKDIMAGYGHISCKLIRKELPSPYPGKYFLLFLKTLDICFFANQEELNKKLKELNFKKTIILMDVNKFFEKVKKTATDIEEYHRKKKIYPF